MCRHLAYLGPPRSLRQLLLEPPHSLLRQSWAPRRQHGHGVLNADGFGVGWYAAGHDEPVVYRRATPMWQDGTFADVARVLAPTAVLAAVRSATPGLPFGEADVAPFRHGPWLFSHNGAVEGWPGTATPLARDLPTGALVRVGSAVDAALVWALVLQRLERGARPADALADVVLLADVTAPGSRLNLLLHDGRQVAATTSGHSLSWRTDGDALVVASEPHDDEDGWHDVPPRSVLAASPEGVQVVPLSRPAR